MSVSTPTPCNYQQKYGPRVVANGHEIVPIPAGAPSAFALPGHSLPFKTEPTWTSPDAPVHDLAISGRSTPLVLVETSDPDLLEEITTLVERTSTMPLQRRAWRDSDNPDGCYARAIGFVFRTDEPFRSMSSCSFLDASRPLAFGDDDEPHPNEDRHRLMVLGSDAGWVAYGINPATGRPFRWHEKIGPHCSAWSSLPKISGEEAAELCVGVNRIMRSRDVFLELDTQPLCRGPREAVEVRRLRLSTSGFHAVVDFTPATSDLMTVIGFGIELWRSVDFEHNFFPVWLIFCEALQQDVDYVQLRAIWDGFDWSTSSILQYFQMEIFFDPGCELRV